MNEINTKENININAHYTNDTKIKKPEHVIVQGPGSIPKHTLYTDKQANAKLRAIEQDIFNSTSEAKVKYEKKKKFLGLF